MRKNIDAHHEQAEAQQLRIVHAAGFDSIPFDIGVFALQKAAKAHWGGPAQTVRTATRSLKGGFSGGTIASMALLFDSIRRDRSMLRLMANPYALVPGETGPDRNDSRAVEYWSDHGLWTTPFIMAGCNTRVVRRSHALLGYPWGRDFSYAEAMGTGRGLRGWLRAQAMRLLLGLLVTVMAVRWTRWLAVGRILPRPGEGPSEVERNRGRFSARVVGTRDDEQLALDVIGEGDPGYLATSRMLAQTAAAAAKTRALHRWLPKQLRTCPASTGRGAVHRRRAPAVSSLSRTCSKVARRRLHKPASVCQEGCLPTARFVDARRRTQRARRLAKTQLLSPGLTGQPTVASMDPIELSRQRHHPMMEAAKSTTAAA